MSSARTTASIVRGRTALLGAVVLAALGAWGTAHVVSILRAARGQEVGSGYWPYFVATFALLAVQQGLAYAERPRTATARQWRQMNARRVIVPVPVYNEDEPALRATLAALFDQSRRPQIVHVIDDGSTVVDYTGTERWAREAATAVGIDLRWTRKANGGKRSAQAVAFAYVEDDDVVVTSDSDGVMDRHAIREVLKALTNPRVAAVAGVVMALNNRTNLLCRITDLLYVGVQMTNRSAQSTVGNVLVNSGPLAAYRGDVIRKHRDGYLRETFMGRPVEFSDDSLLTLYARMEGLTIQQPTAMVFCLMPDRVSHHLRQYLRWMRGSTIRSVWRGRYLPKRSFGYWMHLTTWMQFAMALVVFALLFIVQPVHSGDVSAIPWMLGVSIVLGYMQMLRYLTIRRSDESGWSRLATWTLAPLVVLWSFAVLRWLRLYGMATCARTGWGTRETVEVTLSPAA